MYRRVDVMKSAKEFWKEKFDESPQTDADKLAVVMMAEYLIDFKSNLEPVTGHFFTDAELKERDKEVADKAWDACENSCDNNCTARDGGGWEVMVRWDNKAIETDKQTYLESLQMELSFQSLSKKIEDNEDVFKRMKDK